MREAPRTLTRPEPGFYKVRLVPKAWPVPARIELSEGRYYLELDGLAVPTSWTEADLEAIAGANITEGRLFEHPLLRVVCFGERVEPHDYQWRLAMKAWAEQHDPAHPCLHPQQSIRTADLPATDF